MRLTQLTLNGPVQIQVPSKPRFLISTYFEDRKWLDDINYFSPMTKNKDAQKILITGMPYSGKSYISAFLKKKGENVVDADSVKGLGKWFDKSGNIVDFPADATKEWLDSHNFLWDENFLRSWLAKQKSTVKPNKPTITYLINDEFLKTYKNVWKLY